MKKPEFTLEEAAKILVVIDTCSIKMYAEIFWIGLEVELKHGTRYLEANVTNNHPILTGKNWMVLAHHKETLDYY